MKAIGKTIIYIVVILVTWMCEQSFVDGYDNGYDNEQSIPVENIDYFNGSTGEALSENCSLHELSSDYTWNESDVTEIMLNGNTISVQGSGTTVDGSKLTITSEGTYRISGTLTDGRISVNAGENEVIRLIFNGTDINCSDSAPIYIASAAKVIIVLNDDSKNKLTDGNEYVYDSAEIDEPNAALFSKCDLTINGNGSLTVKANYNDGISSKDGLIIKNSIITVDAADDGIRGKDYVVLDGCELYVNAAANGLKSDEEDDETKGFIYVASGNINVISGGDGMTAQTDALIAGGSIVITAGGGSSGTLYQNKSTKGIKANVNTIIDDGTFEISSPDDAIHANENMSINGGTFSLSTKDDGIHSDNEVTINDGDINIIKSYEGIESGIITINGGNINVVSTDDGLNVAGGNDGSGGFGGPGGGFDVAGDYYIYINGGYIVLNSTGDGMDSNGYILMNDGQVIIHGPSASMNSAIDYAGTFKITGGLLIAAGSRGMAQAPGSLSDQPSIILSFASRQGGTLIHLQDSSGEDVLSFAPLRTYQSVVFSSPALKTEATYDLYFGGDNSGSQQDGLYSGGDYSPGTKYTSFTLSGVVTSVRL